VNSPILEQLAMFWSVVQSVPEPARLLLLGIGFLVGGATLRRKFGTDTHTDPEPIVADGWAKEIKASRFQLRPSEPNMEVVGD
jgi:PEP-CTERM motif